MKPGDIVKTINWICLYPKYDSSDFIYVNKDMLGVYIDHRYFDQVMYFRVIIDGVIGHASAKSFVKIN